jgi:hypothetical protein
VPPRRDQTRHSDEVLPVNLEGRLRRWPATAQSAARPPISGGRNPPTIEEQKSGPITWATWRNDWGSPISLISGVRGKRGGFGSNYPHMDGASDRLSYIDDPEPSGPLTSTRSLAVNMMGLG